MDRPLVSLVTVNHNGRDLLGPLLVSVAAQEWPRDRLEVIVVDNGSDDGSLELLEAEHSEVVVVRNQVNTGFAAANNQAARVARGRYLALLNNDMRLEPGWLDAMTAYLADSPPDLVCAGSLILDWDGSRVDFGGASLAFNGVGFQLQAGDDAGDRPIEAGEMPFACGGAMMVERDVYLETGGFDEDYFAYLEDVDFGWRLWVLGYRVGFCPDAVVNHRHNATSSRFASHRKQVLIERNALYSVIKNYDDESLAAVLPAVLLLAFKRLALRSGVARGDFRFEPEPPPAVAAEAGGPESPLHAFTRVRREWGLRIALRRVVARSLGPLLRRNAAPVVVPRNEGRAIGLTSYATVVAVEDLIDHLPRLLEKRADIQAARRRADGEIVRLFGTPFRPAEQPADVQEAYDRAFETTVRSLGVTAYLASLAERELA